MRFAAPATKDLIVGLAYFGLASIAVSLTRFDGGVAFLWAATALLIAVLMVRPRRNWGGVLLICAVASFAATGLFGFGWRMALPMAIINILEAWVAARLFRSFGHSRTPLGSVPWLMHFILCVGLAGPAVSAPLATVTATLLAGVDPLSSMVHFFAGHALGNLTFVPLFTLVVGGKLRASMRIANRRQGVEGAILIAGVAIVSTLVFAQPAMPLLFVPMLPIILATFRLGQGAAALSIVILALIGGGFTLAGLGPAQLMHEAIGIKVQFFQFYLAATVLTVLPVAADLRRRGSLHRQLRLSEERYRLLADHSSDILMHLDCDGRIRYVSPSIKTLGGYDPEELVGRSANMLVLPADVPAVRQEHLATIADGGRTRAFDYRAIMRDGRERWFETHSRAIIDDDGRVDGVLSVIRDVSQRKATEAKLTAAAMTDPLTGIPNRRAFRSAAELHLLPGSQPTSIAILDIDHFKQVNDRFGHDAGDEVLRSFAAIAQNMMRREDMVARLGGEEFGLLLPNASSDAAVAICDRLRQEVASAITLTAAGPIRITISGGVAELGEAGLDAALRTADEALYRAKAGGRDRMAIAA